MSPGTAKWSISNQQEWQDAIQGMTGIDLADGLLTLRTDSASILIESPRYERKRSARTLMITQSATWDNWQAVASVGPEKATNAPVFLSIGPGDYWFLAAHSDDRNGGYHAWHSVDMKDWIHRGLVTTRANKWVTTAEYLDGSFYIYFDYPNDEDPHLVIDDYLSDNKQGKVVGKIFDDPSHGSDIAVMRDADGVFHMIYEDWSPINAREHSWDSPLAGHADSPAEMSSQAPIPSGPLSNQPLQVHTRLRNIEPDISDPDLHCLHKPLLRLCLT